MTQNVIIIKKKERKIKRDSRGAIVRIDNEAADVIESFANRADISFCELASNFIKFASENTMIREEE